MKIDLKISFVSKKQSEKYQKLHKMKKLPLILSTIALLGVIALFLIVLLGKSTCSSNNTIEKSGTTVPSDLSVAYILTDSILFNYQLAIDLNKDFVSKQTQFNSDFNKRRANLEKQAVAFQEKLQKGGFLTEERAVNERDRLLREEQEIQKLDYELSNKLGEMEQKINLQLIDSIVNYVKEYNQKYNYTYILSNNGNIIVGEQQFNVSKDILDGLNARYAKSKK